MVRLKSRIDWATSMAVCLGSTVNWIHLLTCRQYFQFLSTTLIMGGQFISETPWPSLKHIQLPGAVPLLKENWEGTTDGIWSETVVLCYRFLKSSISQNHRILEVGRDLWWSSGPTLLLKQHHLKPLVLLLKTTFSMPSPEAGQPKDILITQRHLQSQ